MPTEYEVINKATGEISPATNMVMDTDNVQVTINAETENETVVTFSNEGQKGNLQNPDYAIRQVGKKLSANDQAVILDNGTEVAISQELRKDIDDGTITAERAAEISAENQG